MLGTIIFFVLAGIAVTAAIGMLTSANAVHAALFLVLNFTCVALFYLLLNAPFLAMIQITVYAGAIMVLFLFVIMLLGAERVPIQSRLRWQFPLAVVLVVLLLGVTAFIAFSPEVQGSITNPSELTGTDATFGSPAALGERLYMDYMLPIQIVGVLLLVSMMGAVVFARGEKNQALPEGKKATGGD
jgi:NADH-quinone oxidoreductase subunit J